MKKLGQLTKQAWKSLANGDTSAYPTAQATYSKKPTDYLRLSTYGICANAPPNAHVFLIQSEGKESTKFGIENDFLGRLKGLKSGEAALYNSLTKSFVLMKADGSVEIDSKKDIIAIAAGDITATATGDINATAANINAVASENISAIAGGDVDIEAGGDINATATGDIIATAENITATATLTTINGNLLVNGTITENPP